MDKDTIKSIMQMVEILKQLDATSILLMRHGAELLRSKELIDKKQDQPQQTA